ncbi:MAG: hypothetical protein ACE5JL_07640 [Dehalococcoidia bacterium]
MGKYSMSDHPLVDEAIDNCISEIVSHFCPRSIILTGSFGRGEASFIDEEDRVRWLSDCEMLILSDRPLPKSKIRPLLSSLSTKTGINIVGSGSFLLRLYCWVPIPPPLWRLVWKPSIPRYELKHGSTVVFGENILERIPDIKVSDIPLWEGIRLMLNRMAGALEYFPLAHTGAPRLESIYRITKVILASQDALLLSLRRYHPSYEARNTMFQELFLHRFGELGEKLPRFADLATKATAFKLRPEKNAYPGDLMELWFDASDVCDLVFRHVIDRDMNFTFDTYAEFGAKYLGHPKLSKYYLGVIPVPVLQNCITALKMMKSQSYRFPSTRLLASFGTMWKHVVYSVVPLVYFGVSRQGVTGEGRIRHARETIALFKSLTSPAPDTVDEWRYLREQVTDLWHKVVY